VAVFVKRGLIEKIEDAGAARPSGATVIDMTGRFLMPELINAHGHVGLLRGTETSADNYTEANVQRQLLQYQDYGVGAVLVMGTDHDEAYTWRAETQSGARPGARLYTAGRGFGVPDGLPPAAAGMNFVYRPSTPDEARKNVQELARHHPDLIKMWVDDSLGRFPKMSPAVYAAIIDEAHKQHLRAAAHLFYEADAQRLVDLGIDVFAHSVRDADIPDPLLAEMKRKHVVYIGTLSLDDFAVAYDGDPPWLDQPFFRDALEPGSYEMLTSAAFKRKVHDDKVTAAERAALPIALRNLN
jgi:imidazolonepropionase-like amidohydrolase